MIKIFYANLLYGECGLPFFQQNKYSLPDGVYVLVPPGMTVAIGDPGWYRKDLTPVPLEEVPKELRTLLLLL